MEPYAAYAAAASSRPSRFHGFGLCQHNLAGVHVVTRAMQRVASSSEGFADSFDPLLYADLSNWWHSPDCLAFFLVIFFTLRLEYFLRSLEATAELNELRKDLCGGVEPLDYEFSLLILWELELH